MKTFILLVFILIFTSILQAQVKSEHVLYQDGEVELEGFLAYDKLLKSKRGGVLIIHDKYGLNEFIEKRAEELAKLGYVAFAIDMFGKNQKINEKSDIDEILQPFFEENQTLIPQRAQLGLEILSNHSKVDSSRIALIGYGFGGRVAIELAKSGVELAAIINYFGILTSKNNESIGKIKCPLLILMGTDDPEIPLTELNILKDEMNSQGNDWQINLYGGAVHGFTYYELGFETSTGEAYDYNADKRSWEAVKTLLHETLK